MIWWHASFCILIIILSSKATTIVVMHILPLLRIFWPFSLLFLYYFCTRISVATIMLFLILFVNVFHHVICSQPPSPLRICDFVQHVDDLHKDSGYKFSSEYDVSSRICCTYSFHFTINCIKTVSCPDHPNCVERLAWFLQCMLF